MYMKMLILLKSTFWERRNKYKQGHIFVSRIHRIFLEFDLENDVCFYFKLSCKEWRKPDEDILSWKAFCWQCSKLNSVATF